MASNANPSARMAPTFGGGGARGRVAPALQKRTGSRSTAQMSAWRVTTHASKAAL